eukprot:scaffold27987_cov80-Skeletonema_marinoi.AAC.1
MPKNLEADLGLVVRNIFLVVSGGRARSAQAKKSRSPKIHNFRSSLRPLLQIDKRMKDEGVVAKPAGASSSEMLILCYAAINGTTERLEKDIQSLARDNSSGSYIDCNHGKAN